MPGERRHAEALGLFRVADQPDAQRGPDEHDELDDHVGGVSARQVSPHHQQVGQASAGRHEHAAAQPVVVGLQPHDEE
jgi:hypothetical protein